MKFFYSSIFLIVLVKYSSSALEYIPPSREIEVIEENSYTFGVKEDDTTNITRCFYTTDTGISGYFDVKKEAPPPTVAPSLLLENEYEYYENYQNLYQSINVTVQSDNNEVWDESNNNYEIKYQSDGNNEVRVIHNEITNRGGGGACEMTIKWVDDQGPSKWTLKPYDNQTEGNQGNLTDITYNIDFLYKAKLLQPTISIYVSQTFYQYINMTNINFKTCILTFDNSTMDLPMTTNKKSSNYFLSPYSEGDEETIKRISSFGRGLCGFKVVNATAAESRYWTLTGTDDKGNRYRSSFKSSVSQIDPSSRNTTKSVVLGDSATVVCGDPYDQLFCYLFNPAGNAVFTNSISDCTHSIPTVAMTDIGIWKCLAGKPNGIETVTYIINVIIDNYVNDKPVEIWANQTDENTFSIGCQIVNYGSSGISYCKITAPNHQVIMPKPGVATGRYLSFGTDFKKAFCRIEMSTPLLDIEKGRWQCEIYYYSTSSIGDFINVDSDDTPDYPKHSNVTLQLGQSYQVKCQVPYSSEYCHIKAPNGTIYPTKDPSEPRVGRCSMERIQADNVSDNGTWTCSFARGIGIPDDEIYVEITIAEVFEYYKIAEVDVGNTAQLMCRSGGLPFKYCRYLAPNGTGYQITNHQTSNTISYYGKGLEYGECGISIADVQKSDNGNWTCVVQIGSGLNSQPEITAQIMLEVKPPFYDDPNIAAAIGISVGVVVVTSILVLVGVQRWRRRRHTEVPGSTVTARHINNDDDSNSETLDIFSVAPVPRSYTNSQATAEDESHAHQL